MVRINLEGRLHLVNGDSIEILPGVHVFIGSKHTYESQYLLVNTTSQNVVLASDNCWFYYNLEHMLSVPLTFDQHAYMQQLRRMKTLVTDTNLIIPGHDNQVSRRFPESPAGVMRIK
jgi:glyoxylase-like metal-dependent hydrolase (beta-lactamase superfamily II)